jgi:tryptophan halogenase
VTTNDEESFQETSWASLFLGCGIMPKSYDPRIDLIAGEQHIQKVQQQLRDAARLAQQMPKVEELFLDRATTAQLSG